MTANDGDVGRPAVAELLAMLDTDAQGWAVARAVREDGRIVDFTLTYLNRAGERILGGGTHDLLGRRYRELWPETVNDATLPLYRQVVEDRTTLTRTVYYDRPSVAGHFELRVGPCGDGFVARFVDLTQLTVAPQSEGGTRLYEMLDAAFDGFTLLRAVRDDTGTIVDFVCEYVNQIGAKLVGRGVEQIVGRRVTEVAPDSVRSGIFERYRATVQSDAVWREQLSYPGLGQVWEVKMMRADVDTVAVSFRDITEQAGQQERIEQTATRAQRSAERITALQATTAALVAASTSEEVYAAMGAVVRPSANGIGLAVLLSEDDRLKLHYHDGYEPEIVASLRELPATHQYPAAGVARTGQPRYLSTPEEFTAAQPDPASAISGGGRHAWAFLPLVTAGHVLGTLVIGYAEPRDFDEQERGILLALSGLCAQALQRALLFEAQMSIAATLQRALLPAVLPQLPGVRHAARYLPWTQGAEVGGDWYDVIAVRPDAVAVVIGDVVGHNANAAATMGQIRNALHAYAAEGHSPTGVMHRVNHLLARLAPEALATCCYLELHLREGTATAVLAGHPPPIMRAAHGAATLALRVGPPLGSDPDVTYFDTSFLVPTGATLLLYTDGLVEDRRYDLTRGLTELSAAVAAAPPADPQRLVDYVLTADVGPHPRSDDVAILALTVDTGPPAGSRAAQRHFRSDAVSVPQARRFAADILRAWQQPELIADACLLLDEVITNAVQHTVGDVGVRMTLGDVLRIEVHDSSDRMPERRPVELDSESGRGLHIVARLARDWGYTALPAGGKAVWFELPPTA